MKEKTTIKNFTMTSLFIALTYLATALIQIPIPLGYANLGDCIILLCAFYFGLKMSCISGALGAALADILTGYAIWAIPTIIVKSLVAISAYIFFRNAKKTCTIFSLKMVAGCVVSMFVMTLGYTVFGAILYGSIGAGLASTPGLALEGVVNIIAFSTIGTVLCKAKIF